MKIAILGSGVIGVTAAYYLARDGHDVTVVERQSAPAAGLAQRLLRVLEREPSKRSIDDAVLVERIRAIHAESDATYGMPRVRAELIDQGVKVNGKRVARLMRANAIRGVSRRRGFVVTTQRDQRQRPAPDLVKRELSAPDRGRSADRQCVRTTGGQHGCGGR